MPSIKWNKRWNAYAWSKDGDEWDGQARYCKQPYEAWKRSVFETFIRRHLHPSAAVLEIASGHGRWSPYLIENAARIWLVDLNPSCVEYLKRKFSRHDNVSCHLNDGKSLPFIGDASLDFIWSYDSFVHMEKGPVQSYFLEFTRVLRQGGKAVIHHAGRRHLALPFAFLSVLGPQGKWLFRILSMKRDTAGGGDGDRSRISNRTIRRLARAAGLAVLYQVDTWGDRNQFNCKRFNDTITALAKPEPS